MMMRTIFFSAFLVGLIQATAAAGVETLRVPQGGIQPQLAMDPQGNVYLVYFKGAPEGGDLFYVKSADQGATWSDPLRVNSMDGSAVAVGNVRGAHLALGKNNRVHVAWNGSSRAQPRGPAGAAPMLYTRLDEKGAAFEKERNLIRSAYGLDGGGSVAADGTGNVYVVWHAGSQRSGEGRRRVFVARSKDDGKTFAKERSAWKKRTGACGCCGMGALALPAGGLHLLYRSAGGDGFERDMYLLSASTDTARLKGNRIDRWKIGRCVMSTAAMTVVPNGLLATWETKGQVWLGRFDAEGKAVGRPVSAPGATGQRKHPVAARNAKGETILVWTEGMGWKRGGSVAWQVYDAKGKPTGQPGSAFGVPVWSLVAVFARRDGTFVVVY